MALICLLLLGPEAAFAEIRFDVFVGYQGNVPRGDWFPVVCEVVNDGPSFHAVVEVRDAGVGQGDVRRLALELPTGTLKRFVVPMHAPTLYTASFDARLLDERRRVRAESLDIRVQRQEADELPLVASVARSLPVFPEMKAQDGKFRVRAARIQPQVFPDHAISLEGLDVVFLTSGRALELEPAQAEALRLWVHGGGHLVLGVEQAGQVQNNAWLAALVDCQLEGGSLVEEHGGLHEWLVSDRTVMGTELGPRLRHATPARGSGRRRGFENPYASLERDASFEEKPMQVARLTRFRGQVVAGPEEWPLIVGGNRGLGHVTILAFNPELEPFSSWERLPEFWAKTCQVPPELLGEQRMEVRTAYQNLDPVFATLIETEQVQKLPVGWLLFLLVVYLMVIGPLDRYWLKKINRQMLTWLTFPAYVVCFSLLIYFIGYKLRAGETEWNELHVVNVVPMEDGSGWRGRSYGSLYSPANARYGFASDEPYATLRSEFAQSDPGRGVVRRKGGGFEAEMSVSVWTSRLLVHDWWKPAQPVVTARFEGAGDQAKVVVRNEFSQPCQQVCLAYNDRWYELGSLDAGESREVTLSETMSQPLERFVTEQTGGFQSALNARRRAFGPSGRSRIDDKTHAAMAAGFIDLQSNYRFFAGAAMDLVPQLERGDAILLAWTRDHRPITPFHQFEARRGQRDVLWRVLVPDPDPARP